MTALPSSSNANAPPTLSQQQKDALIGELLGDVLAVHQSVRDLSTIVCDTDERISTRLIELRALSQELAGMRESVLAQVGLEARNQAQQAFRQEMGDLLGRLNLSLDGLLRVGTVTDQRRFIDLITVAISAGAVVAAVTLGTAWLIFH